MASKWGYRYTADWAVDAVHHEIKEHTLSHLSHQWEESRALLGPFLNLYQIHSATLESGVLEDEKLLSHLHHLKSEFGVSMGLSLSGPAQALTLAKALEVEFDGMRLFDGVQATLNILERSAYDALREAADAGIRVIIKEGVANGRLTKRNNHPDFSPSMTLLTSQCERLGCTVDALVLAWLLARPWISVVLSGASSVTQLYENLQATSVQIDAEAEEALARLVERPEAYWAFRKSLAWN